MASVKGGAGGAAGAEPSAEKREDTIRGAGVGRRTAGAGRKGEPGHNGAGDAEPAGMKQSAGTETGRQKRQRQKHASTRIRATEDTLYKPRN